MSIQDLTAADTGALFYVTWEASEKVSFWNYQEGGFGRRWWPKSTRKLFGVERRGAFGRRCWRMSLMHPAHSFSDF